MKTDIEFTNEYPEKMLQPYSHFPDDSEMIFSRKETTSQIALIPEDKISFKEVLRFLFVLVCFPGLVFLVFIASFCLWLGDIQENRQYRKQLEEKKEWKKYS